MPLLQAKLGGDRHFRKKKVKERSGGGNKIYWRAGVTSIQTRTTEEHITGTHIPALCADVNFRAVAQGDDIPWTGMEEAQGPECRRWFGLNVAV